jgi:MSHA biogenesis protein MshE
VFSTLHTKDAASTPLRLVDMGAPAYMVAGSLHAVLAQRLVRLICETCAADAAPAPQEARWLAALPNPLAPDARLRRGRGCSHCNGSGYAGRIGVYEMLEMTPELVRAAGRADPNVFLEAARAALRGRTLTDHALALVAAGRTTVAEAMKVAGQLED